MMHPSDGGIGDVMGPVGFFAKRSRGGAKQGDVALDDWVSVPINFKIH